MKKTLLFLFLLVLLTGNSYAKQRTVAQALNEAQNFVQSQPALRSSASATFLPAETGLKTPYYYVFNRSNNAGFVIVSGDDRAKTVLGYSDTGHFDVENLPINMKYWLRGYENELQALSEGKVTQVEEITPQLRTDFAASINPLIESEWNQGTPYNNLCPVIPTGKPNAGTKTVTGCVATAMAQIMRFHQYPATYNFSVNYKTKTLGITINETLSGTYDWGNMPYTYSSSSTTNQNSAVATLMYTCGVSVDMDYDTSSGADMYSPAEAFTDKFGYDANLQYYTRAYYSDAEWINLLKTDLNAGLPVLYGGVDTRPNKGGHEFVCDGYDANDYFHFNWGWGGTYNGNYVLSALNPTGYQFNSNQAILAGIQPPNFASTPPPYQLIADTTIWTNKEQTTRTGTFNLQTKGVYNLGTNTVPANGYWGIGLYSVEQALVDTNYAKVPFERAMMQGLNFEDIFTNVYIPASIPNGDYRFYIIYSPDKINWTKIRVDRQFPSYLAVKLTSTNVIFSPGTTAIATPTVENNAITVYPNPVEDVLHIQSQQPILGIAIVDLTGKTQLKQVVQTTGELSVPVNRLATGLYILQTKTAAGVTSTKFIKK
jgi:hypothetical protein